MDDRLEKISIHSKDSVYEVSCLVKRSSRARRINIRVESREKIVLTLPHWASASKGFKFIEEQTEWLAKRIENIPLQVELNQYFAEGGKVWISSHCRDLKVNFFENLQRQSHEISFDQINLNLCCLEKGINQEIFSFLFNLAKVNLIERISKHSKDIGLQFRKVRIGNQKSRWGSCSAKGTISLNWRLILLPYSMGEYVIFHELAHLKHLNHSRKFWNYLESIFPDTRSYDKELRSVGKKIMNLGRFP